MEAERHRQRIARCTTLMRDSGLDVLLLTKPANMTYLTGDGRLCAYAMITREGVVALGVPVTDVEDVSALAVFDLIVGFDDEVGMIHSIAHFFKELGFEQGTVGLENTFLTGAMRGVLTHPHAKPAAVEAKDCTHVMTQLRIVKDDDEVAYIRAAGRVAAIGMAASVTAVRPGVSESEVAGAGEYAMRQAGAEEFYRSYVSSGRRTSIAHGLPTTAKVKTGDLVMIDLHPVVDGYSADICRTVCVGQPSAEQRAVYDIYLHALEATIAKVTAGVEMVELEETMHAVMRDAGHGDHIFGPPIHGVGLEFEEPPLPAGHAFFHGEAAPPPLAANTAIAIGNCGLYAGPWGIRVEDTVIVGAEGAEIVTAFRYGLTV
ncbi:MAG: M24 family metallopeptidase [Thermoleophilia bacterium]